MCLLFNLELMSDTRRVTIQVFLRYPISLTDWSSLNIFLVLYYIAYNWALMTNTGYPYCFTGNYLYRSLTVRVLAVSQRINPEIATQTFRKHFQDSFVDRVHYK